MVSKRRSRKKTLQNTLLEAEMANLGSPDYQIYTLSATSSGGQLAWEAIWRASFEVNIQKNAVLECMPLPLVSQGGPRIA